MPTPVVFFFYFKIMVAKTVFCVLYAFLASIQSSLFWIPWNLCDTLLHIMGVSLCLFVCAKTACLHHCINKMSKVLHALYRSSNFKVPISHSSKVYANHRCLCFLVTLKCPFSQSSKLYANHPCLCYSCYSHQSCMQITVAFAILVTVIKVVYKSPLPILFLLHHYNQSSKLYVNHRCLCYSCYNHQSWIQITLPLLFLLHHYSQSSKLYANDRCLCYSC